MTTDVNRQEIEALIDTGFDGPMAVPPALIANGARGYVTSGSPSALLDAIQLLALWKRIAGNI